MKLIGQIAIVLSILLALSAIWVPGHWWQFLLTAIVALFVGAAILGGKQTK